MPKFIFLWFEIKIVKIRFFLVRVRRVRWVRWVRWIVKALMETISPKKSQKRPIFKNLLLFTFLTHLKIWCIRGTLTPCLAPAFLWFVKNLLFYCCFLSVLLKTVNIQQTKVTFGPCFWLFQPISVWKSDCGDGARIFSTKKVKNLRCGNNLPIFLLII